MSTTKAGRQGQSESHKPRRYLKQSDAPGRPIQETLRVAGAIRDQHACSPTKPLLVAKAAGLSPNSSVFRELCGASIAYGITTGGYNAKEISLTERGRRIVAPTEDGDDSAALREAALAPRLFGAFLKKYNGNRVPQKEIALNVLADLGAPRDRAAACYEVLLTNAKDLGLIEVIKGAEYVSLEPPASPVSQEPEQADELLSERAEEEEPGDRRASESAPPGAGENQRVFIAHGKNLAIVGQVKDILKFGKFEPVVAEEQETTSKPVPDKVFDDMRRCFAGIIHVASEEKVLTEDSQERHLVNENVLIEIGAALALYRRNVILLVQRGISLPSNLQGLYRCDYEGDQLDYAATMKLLKAFNKFQPLPSS